MGMIHGITVSLSVKTRTGADAFNVPTYSQSWVNVNNVVVSPSTTEEVTDTITLYGKRAVYTLCIPTSDTHNWTDTEVKFFNQKWRTIGPPKQYMEHMLPLEWNKQVMVESCLD